MNDLLEGWRQRASRGGKTDLDALTATTDDGIPFGPIYPASDAGAIAGRGTGPWTVFERIESTTKPPLAVSLESASNGGADGIAMVMRYACGARVDGDAPTIEAVEELLARSPDATVRLEPGEQDLARVTALLTRNRNGVLVFDPYTCLASQGFLESPLADLIDTAIAHAGGGHATVAADGRFWHDCGATEALELAIVVAAIVAVLRRAAETGVPGDKIAANLGVMVAVDANQFLNIAKLRALRLLLGRVLAGIGTDAAVTVHAETSWRMTTRRDPYLNMLRATSAVVAAATAGADSIAVSPLPLADDEFAARMARNIQVMAMAESSLGRVTDPGAGSGAVESLTESLAAAAWDILRDIENSGGLTDALTSGKVQNLIATERDARETRGACRELEIVGVNIHVDREAGQAPPAPEPVRLAKPQAPPLTASSLAPKRLAEPFEHAGDRAKALADAGSPPTIFVASLAPANAASLIDGLAALGLPVVDGGSFDTPEALREAFIQSKAEAVAVASDPGKSVDPGLKAAGARVVIGTGIAGLDAELNSSTDLPALGALIMDRFGGS